MFLSVSKKLRRSTLVKYDKLLTESDVGVSFHQHLEEVEFAHVTYPVNLDNMLVVLQVHCCKKIGSHCVRATERCNNEVIWPRCNGLNLYILVTLDVTCRLVEVLVLTSSKLVIILIEVAHAHQNTQVRILTNCNRN